MKILLIHQAFASPEQAGGTRHYELGRYLVGKGHSFSIVASNLSYITGKAVIADGGPEVYDGVQVRRAYTHASLHRNFVWRVVSFFSFMFSSVWTAMKGERPDLVMGTTPPIFQAASAWFISALHRRPFLLEVRDLWPDFAIDMGVLKNPVLIRLSRWLERFLYARADHLLVNSPAYRDHLINKGIPAEKITLIPNGVDCDMFDPSEDGKKVRMRLGVDGKFLVTYAGALGAANDIPTILNAAESLRGRADIHFAFVGDGKDRQKAESLAKAKGLNNVTFTGAVPKSEMPLYLAASDAGIATLQNIPMFRTTYPNKVFDYMAAGRPTILGIDGVIREVVETGGAGIFVQPGDSKALADAVVVLADDRNLAGRMGKSAREHVVKYFNRSDQAKEFLKLIEKLGRDNRATEPT